MPEIKSYICDWCDCYRDGIPDCILYRGATGKPPVTLCKWCAPRFDEWLSSNKMQTRSTNSKCETCKNFDNDCVCADGPDHG